MRVHDLRKRKGDFSTGKKGLENGNRTFYFNTRHVPRVGDLVLIDRGLIDGEQCYALYVIEKVSGSGHYEALYEDVSPGGSYTGEMKDVIYFDLLNEEMKTSLKELDRSLF